MTDTKQKILKVACATVQDRGYAGLSFRDLAADIGIKSASIHYHFPSKGDLGRVLMRQYTDDFAAYLDGLLAAGDDQQSCLRAYIEVFRTILLNENRICLGGILAAEHNALPAEMRAELLAFTEMNVDWLVRVLSLGRKKRAPDEALRHRALAIFAAVEGAQLIARSRNDIAIYDDVVAAYGVSGLLP